MIFSLIQVFHLDYKPVMASTIVSASVGFDPEE